MHEYENDLMNLNIPIKLMTNGQWPMADYSIEIESLKFKTGNKKQVLKFQNTDEKHF